MGLTKQYLRYVYKEMFGIIGSHQSNISFVHFRKTVGRFVAVGACEDVIIWDLRSRAKALVLKGGRFAVTVLKTSPSQNHLAVGYVDGGISVFDLDSGQVLFQFNGHKSPVTVLNYNKDGFILVSGGKDTNVILWDVLQGAGMYRLKGHKGPITQAVFVTEDNVLITSSKDTHVKFWDLDTQHCFHTVVAHRSEVTDILVTPNRELITGCADSELRIWGLKANKDVNENKAKKLRLDMSQPVPEEDDIEEKKDLLCPMECLKIGSVMRQSKERLLSMKIDSTGRSLVCLNNDSSIEVYLLATDEELEKRLTKRRKKMRRRSEKTEEEAKLTLSDAFKKFGELKVAKKGHSFDCVLEKNVLKIVCLSSNNTLSWYNADMSSSWQETPERELLYTFGHRTDIRTICFSSDNTAILTASADCVKIWNRTYLQCISTIECDYALCSLFLPGDRLCIIGTKTGKLQLFEIATATLLETFDAHDEPVWGIHMSPDKNGICSGSGDKCIKFWSFEWLVTENEDNISSKRLTLQHQRTLQMDEGILAIIYSPNNLLVCVALMDNTVKLFYTDTLKFFVSLYGHSMPVLCLDISSDSEFIVTGSADRDIKLWGLDFGDCRKSLFAHDGSVTCVKFIPNTHMFFSCGKDKKIRQWDGDNFLPILTLQGHQDDIRCLAVSSSSNFIATASHDKTIRLWEKSEEIVIPEEEKEREREEELDKEYEETELQIPGEDSKEVGHASRMTLDTVKSIDKLMEVLAIHKEESEKPAKERAQTATSHPFMRAYNVNSSEKLVKEIFTRIRPSEMEGTLFGLPYDQAIMLLKLLQIFIQSKWSTFRAIDAILFLLRIHHNQIVNDKAILPLMIQLNKSVQSNVTQLLDASGYNLHGLKMFQRLQEEFVEDELVL